MVYNVCLRVTKNAHDAEDATQAVFLALAAQGKTGKPVRYIGPWLQQVGRRLSLDIRRSRKRRTRREEIVGEMHRENGNNGHGGNGVASCPSHHLSQSELKAVLNEELNQLPAKYRLPLVLHYFGGLSRDEMARELGVKANTLGVRVCRGRDMLAKRLATRGVTIGAAAIAVLMAEMIRETVTDTLIASTCHAATRYAAAKGAGDIATGVVSTHVVTLAESVARALVLAKVKTIATIIVMACTAVAGGGEAIGRVSDFQIPQLMPSNLAQHIRALLRDVVRPIRLTSAAPGEDLVPDVTDNDLLGDARVGELAYLAPGSSDVPLAPLTAAATTAVSRSHQAAGMPPRPLVMGGTGLGGDGLTLSKLPPTPRAVPAAVVVNTPVEQPRPAAPPPSRATIANARPQNVTVDAPRNGGVTSRMLSHGQLLTPQNLTVGDRGAATFHQRGGTNRVADQLVLGAQPGSRGTYRLDDGELYAREQIIGKAGKGELEQKGGKNTVRDTIYVGFDQSGEGAYTLAGGTVNAGQLYVPKGGKGTWTQTGGMTTMKSGSTAADLIVGADAGSTGTYHLSNGTLQADYQVIGQAGSGEFLQVGGVNDVAVVDLGTAKDGDGHYVLKSGTIRLDNVLLDSAAGAATTGVTPDDIILPTIRIGGAGDGSFVLGGLNKSATIIDLHGQTGLTVRSQATANGEFRGWGVVGLQGPFVNNGKVIADGFGTARALDFTSAASVSNVINNDGSAESGGSGWFARRGGRLLLPPIPTRLGVDEYTWGEDETDESLDLINSVRVRMSGVTNPGEIRIALLALDRIDLPELPAGHNFIGAWSFDAGETEFGHVALTVRYDDLAASALGLDENVLKLWRYDDGQWQRINDDSFGRDIDQNLVWGRTNDLSYFAVSAPEPTCLGAVVLGSWALMRRVRRNRA